VAILALLLDFGNPGWNKARGERGLRVGVVYPARCFFVKTLQSPPQHTSTQLSLGYAITRKTYFHLLTCPSCLVFLQIRFFGGNWQGHARCRRIAGNLWFKTRHDACLSKGQKCGTLETHIRWWLSSKVGISIVFIVLATILWILVGLCPSW